MFFSDWYSLLRIAVVGVCAYAALVVLLRATGKRTLSKFNAFDFVVTVALGSTLATVLLSKDVALVDGVVALALLILLQMLVTWLTVRSKWVDRIVKSEPRLLYYRGEFLRSPMRRERVTEGEIRSAIREQGIGSLEEVEAVVLETSGTISVTRRAPEGSASTLHGVEGKP